MKIRHIITSLAALAIATASPIALGEDYAKKDGKAKQSIPEVAMETESLSTLVTLLQAGELVEALQAEGPFTVFAPQNEAFEKLSEEQVAYLTSEAGKADLQSILTYHVVPGKVMAKDVTVGEVETLNAASKISITMDGDEVLVNGNKVIKADVKAGNGVVHIIDGVLVPDGAKLEG